VGHALTQTLSYDPDSRLISTTVQSVLTATTPLSATYQYGYLPVGWTSVVTTTQSAPVSPQTVVTYTHDSLGHLISQQNGTSVSTRTYDGDGNLGVFA
jgi:hypothetical protein